MLVGPVSEIVVFSFVVMRSVLVGGREPSWGNAGSEVCEGGILGGVAISISVMVMVFLGTDHQK